MKWLIKLSWHKCFEKWTFIEQCDDWYTGPSCIAWLLYWAHQSGAGWLDTFPSLLFPVPNLTGHHQGPSYQLHIIWCGIVTAAVLKGLNQSHMSYICVCITSILIKIFCVTFSTCVCKVLFPRLCVSTDIQFMKMYCFNILCWSVYKQWCKTGCGKWQHGCCYLGWCWIKHSCTAGCVFTVRQRIYQSQRN